MTNLTKLLLGLCVPVILLALWQSAYVLIGYQLDSLALPTQIAVSMYQQILSGVLFAAAAQTCLSAFGGLLLGGGLGLLLGISMGLFKPLAKLLSVPVELLRPVPAITLIPLSLLVFGLGFRLEIAVVAFACFWPLLLMSQSAISSVEPRLLEVARMLGFGFGKQVWLFVLPASMPYLFVAFRLATAVSLIVAVTVEIAVNPLGLGYGMMSAESALQSADMFADLVTVGILGALINFGTLWAEKHLFPQAKVDKGIEAL